MNDLPMLGPKGPQNCLVSFWPKSSVPLTPICCHLLPREGKSEGNPRRKDHEKWHVVMMWCKCFPKGMFLGNESSKVPFETEQIKEISAITSCRLRWLHHHICNFAGDNSIYDYLALASCIVWYWNPEHTYRCGQPSYELVYKSHYL